jgi:hypothetical protein
MFLIIFVYKEAFFVLEFNSKALLCENSFHEPFEITIKILFVLFFKEVF